MGQPAASYAPDFDPEIYQEFPDSLIGSRFWDFYKIVWTAERRFDLIFRQDEGVCVWAANRVRLYYDIAHQLGLYSRQSMSPAEPLPVACEALGPLMPVDLYIQTGATGPATSNRQRPLGCCYTERFVARMLDRGARILLLHDAPEALDRRDGLQAIDTQELRTRLRQIGTRERVAPVVLEHTTVEFWHKVAGFFASELGVSILTPDWIAKVIRSHHQQVRWYHELFRQLQPNAMILMSHYFRAPQIEVAQKLKIYTIDYQHGINSRYHLGYGFPNIRPEKRQIPYFPDEFWSWGPIWTDPAWFPHKACRVRELGHPDHDEPPATDDGRDHVDEREPNRMMVATSWAMQTAFQQSIAALARTLPDWQIVVKLHPREQVEDYGLLRQAHSNIEIIAGHVDVLEAAASVRYVISICSSSLFDVLLKGCRIAILRSPSAEYAEDFARRYDVPILEENASNFPEVLARLQSQELPVDEIFTQVSAMHWQLLAQSLSLSPELFRQTLVRDKKPKAKMARNLRKRLLTKGRPWHEFRLPFLRRWLRRHYLDFVNERLLSIQDPVKRGRLLWEAITAGLAPGRFAPAVFSTVQALAAGKNRRSARRLLGRVMADRRPENAILQAQLCENWLSLSADRTPDGTRLPARRWQAGADVLRELSPLSAWLADRYAGFAGRARAEFGDTRVSADERQRLQEDIVARLRSGEPFTMLRLGDDEVYAFEPDYVPKAVLEDERAECELIWYGQIMDEPVRHRLRQDMVDAITHADMLGIPSIFRLLHDMPQFLPMTRGPVGQWSRTARAHVVLLEELERLTTRGCLNWSTTSLLDDRCHQDLFRPQQLQRYMTIDRPRILIDCFGMTTVNAALGMEFFTHEIRMAPHAEACTFHPSERLYPKSVPGALDALLAEIERHLSTDPVFFIGEGPAGKILIGRIAELGATALDVGSAAHGA